VSKIRKTLSILKARWPEVALIIGISLLAILSNRLTSVVRSKSIPIIGLIIPFVLLTLMLIRTLLYCGFLRTVYLEDAKRQSPLVLLRIGIHFLWRMIVLSLIYWLLLILPFLIYYSLIYKHVKSPQEFTSPQFFWIFTLYPIFINLVFIKLILLIPALVIVSDCRTFESFKFLKFCKLSNAIELVILYCINIAIGLFLSILSRYCCGVSCGSTCCSGTAIPQYILRIMYSTVANFISLMIAVMAVRFTHQCLLNLKTQRNIEAEI
jgi:hypothetical protein